MTQKKFALVSRFGVSGLFGWISLALWLFLSQFVSAQIPTEPNPPLETAPLRIINMDGEAQATFTVELADDFEERRRGYMHRAAPKPEEGMLFIFPPNDTPSMYMANVSFALDMLFISDKGEIEAVIHQAQPGSLRSLSAGVPARAVLELLGGQAEENNIEPGMRVEHGSFANLGEAAENNGEKGETNPGTETGNQPEPSEKDSDSTPRDVNP